LLIFFNLVGLATSLINFQVAKLEIVLNAI